MRYLSNAELPERISAVLPEHAKSTFREMINHALAQRIDEERAMWTAWQAVSRRYVRGPDGYWTQRPEWA